MGYCHMFFQWHVRAIVMNQNNRDVPGMMWMSLKIGTPNSPTVQHNCHIEIDILEATPFFRSPLKLPISQVEESWS